MSPSQPTAAWQWRTNVTQPAHNSLAMKNYCHPVSPQQPDNEELMSPSQPTAAWQLPTASHRKQTLEVAHR